MAKKKKPLKKLQCTSCKEINYFTQKPKVMESEGTKIELKKFCKRCKKHTLHKEGRKT